MPLFCIDESKDNYKFAIWKRDESISYFLENMSLDLQEISQIYGLLHTRILEWLSSRYLLKLILGKDNTFVFLKDQFGKPYISGSSKFVTLSHSGKWIAAAVSDLPVGIDIEKLSNKVVKVKDKFVSDLDVLKNEGEEEEIFLSRLWTIKEAVYKAYGKKELIFKDQIRLLSNNKCSIELNKNEILNYSLDSRMFDDYIVSIAILKIKNK